MQEAAIGARPLVAHVRSPRLVRAFDRVRNPGDWKAPIQAVISAADRRSVQQAVILFTGCWPTFSRIPGQQDLLAVTSPGCRSGSWEE